MSFSKHSDNVSVCHTKPLDSLKNWNGHFFWVDDFACPAFFQWHTAKLMTRDPASVAVDFNTQDYATLVAHPSMFWKFIEAFLCLVGLSRHYTLDEETYPWFLHKNSEGGNGYLCFHHTLNPTKVRVAERERNEGFLMRVVVATKQNKEISQELRHQRKRKSTIVDAGGVSHPPKKPMEDHGTSSGTSIGGKSWSALQRLLVGAVLNVEVEVAAIPTLPFVTAYVSITSKREDGDHTDSVAELNLVGPSPFGAGSSLAIGTEPTMGVFSDLTSNNFLIGAICIVVNPDTNLQKMVDELAHPKFFASVRGMEHDQLFAEFNVGAARQMSLNVREEKIKNLKAQLLLREAKAAEAIRLRAEASNFEAVEKSFWDETNALRERNAIPEKERNALDVKVTELETSAVGKGHELTGLNALITSMGLHLEEKFYPHLLTTISGRRWLLTQGMELAIIKCLNSPEYLSALKEAINKAIEKGMHDGLSAGITHGKECRVLTDVATHNPFVEVDYIFALQQIQNVNFPLLVELKSYKDASIETMMDILCLEGPLVDKLGLDELQPNVDQLMVPTHHSPNKVVIGATALSFALDVSSIRVQKIKENVSNHILDFHDVFVPLAKPFSIAALIGTEGTSDAAAATADATMILPTTFASASTIAPISVDDYDIIGVDDQVVADGDAASFPNVNDAELSIPQ
nr:hypothetical protein [Tanacetum cinerariifolium]